MSTPEEPKNPETPPHNEKFAQLMADVKKVLADAGRLLGPMATKGMHAAEEGIKKGVDLIKSQLNKPKSEKTDQPNPNGPTFKTTTTTTNPINPPSSTPETPRVTPINPDPDADKKEPPQPPKP
jgi:hypothetical protein